MSKYFTLAELACRDGTHVPNEYLGHASRLMDQLDVIREDRGGPVQVVSGYRTGSHNAGRGVDGSKHLTAEAADIRPIIKHDGRTVRWASIPLPERVQIILDFHAAINRLIRDGKLPEIGGVGLYVSDTTGWVHVDIRPRGPNERIARWVGATMGSEKIG